MSPKIYDEKIHIDQAAGINYSTPLTGLRVEVNLEPKTTAYIIGQDGQSVEEGKPAVYVPTTRMKHGGETAVAAEESHLADVSCNRVAIDGEP